MTAANAGLARPGHGQIIIEGPVGFSENDDLRGADGRRPRVGRLEVVPPPRARPSTDYHREWSVSHKRVRPVTDCTPALRSAAGDPCSAR